MIDRCFKVIEALKRPTTIRQLSEKLGVDYVSAYRWLEAASLHCQVAEVGTISTGGPRESIQYQIVGRG